MSVSFSISLSEAAVLECSTKSVFLNISQNAQESKSVWVSTIIKKQG